jgi:hypothetical protein
VDDVVDVVLSNSMKGGRGKEVRKWIKRGEEGGPALYSTGRLTTVDQSTGGQREREKENWERRKGKVERDISAR